MKETKMFEAVMITGSGVETMRVSNSKKLLNEFVENYIHRFYKSRFLEVFRGEDCYTMLCKNNDFISAIKIRKIAGIVASPEELEEEKRERERETEKTAKNDTYAE